MTADAWDDLVARLQSHGVAFDAGLTNAEVIAAETKFAFRFPPDLRAFLQTALPRGRRLPDWRSGDEAELRDWLGPETLTEAKRVVEQLVGRPETPRGVNLSFGYNMGKEVSR